MVHQNYHVVRRIIIWRVPSFLDLDSRFRIFYWTVEKGIVDYGTPIHWSIRLPSSHYMCYYY